MGARATVEFVAVNTFFPDAIKMGSPIVYLHWNGPEALDWIKEAAPLLRESDPHYAAARFCAYCAERIPGSLSLGIYNSDNPPEANSDEWTYVVNLTEGKVYHNDGKVAAIIDNFFKG